ncbi:MAG: AI-2E family transporter [Prolixibacteraceae bacterium]|jgi:predicted PurR-regulated permease PerM|nr:AI-2E family transporter [Prolixibacteraceae bacterium]
MDRKVRNIIIAAGVIFIVFLLWYFRSIVGYIIIAAVLAMIGRPFVRWLKKIRIWKFHLGASLSAFITLLLIVGFFFGIFRFLIPLLVSEFEQLSTININDYLEQLEVPLNRISEFLYGESISLTDGSFLSIFDERISSFFEMSQVTDLFGAIAGTLGSVFMGVFSVAFISFFFLSEEGMFRQGIMMLSPTGYEERVSDSIDRIAYLLRRYFIGIILEVLLVMTLDTIGLTIIGLDFSEAVVIGMFCGLFNVIPYLGPWIGSAVGVLIGLAININADFMTQTLPIVGWMVLVFVSVQVIDNVLFQPLIYSSSVKAHPMEIFLVIIAAGSFAGIIGMILAIPVYTIFRVLGAEFLSEFKIIRKLTESMDREMDEQMEKKKK